MVKQRHAESSDISFDLSLTVTKRDPFQMISCADAIAAEPSQPASEPTNTPSSEPAQPTAEPNNSPTAEPEIEPDPTSEGPKEDSISVSSSCTTYVFFDIWSACIFGFLISCIRRKRF